MQKKIIKAITLGSVLLILSVELSEVMNFIYILPFIMPFVMFLASSETELYNGGLNYSIPFVFGLISDLSILNDVFILCLVLPAFTYIIKYLVKKLKIPKEPIFFTICLMYAIFTYSMQSPLWVSIISLGYTFLTWKVFDFICSKTLQEKENGAA